MNTNERMRIGVDATALSHKNLTGIGYYLYNVLSVMVKQYSDVEFILYSYEPIQHHIENSGNVCERIVSRNMISTRIGSIWLRYFLPKHLRKDKIRMFWGPQHILPRKVKGVRYVLTVCDLGLLIHPAWGKATNAIVQNVFARLSIRQADEIITISESTKQDVIRICGIPDERIHAIYIATGLKGDKPTQEKVAEVLNKFGINNEYVLYVGTIEPRKNIESIVWAFDLVAENNPNVELVLAGGLGWSYKDILGAIEKAKHSDRIKRLGYISNEEKLCLYTGANVFAFPSHYEGFGMPVLEAFELDTLVVTARNSSLPEVGGEVAIYVNDENNIDELRAALECTLAMRAEERKKRIEEGRVQAGKFTWENCAHETARILMHD